MCNQAQKESAYMVAARATAQVVTELASFFAAAALAAASAAALASAAAFSSAAFLSATFLSR